MSEIKSPKSELKRYISLPDDGDPSFDTKIKSGERFAQNNDNKKINID